MKMEQTECSETSAYKIQTPGNYPEESIEQIIVHHQEVCTSSLQYFTVHLYEESSGWHDTIDAQSSINRIVSA